RIYIHSSEMFSGVTPCQGALPPLRVLSSPAHSSPLVLPESSQNIWLMVRFCRAVISEIMSLDLRRSSICTDCHSPKDGGQKFKKVISCLQHALLEDVSTREHGHKSFLCKGGHIFFPPYRHKRLANPAQPAMPSLPPLVTPPMTPLILKSSGLLEPTARIHTSEGIIW
uniref:Uncharacterized protein n=1 Tax=Strix occidentalis caurina TaxID=311401 RepID=A0A8D0F2R6_STROC